MPSSANEWKSIASEFESQWNYPHCIGAVDGKHVIIKSPSNSGSLYYNYKSTFSIVLMALVDAHYKFIYVDIGAYGKQSDAGIFAHSKLGTALKAPQSLNLPADSVLDCAADLGPIPYVVVGDEAFPLQTHIMRPYPGRQLTLDQSAYNYRHSRARRIVECAFGILAARWRVFHTKMASSPSTIEKVVSATTVLHNMLQKETTPDMQSNLLAESNNEVEGLVAIRGRPARGTIEAIETRCKLTSLFVRHPLPWQENYVQRGLRD